MGESTKTYTKHNCSYCKSTISSNGLCVTSHLRKHAKEGLCTETQDYANERIHFVPTERGSCFLDKPLSIFERYGEFEDLDSFPAVVNTANGKFRAAVVTCDKHWTEHWVESWLGDECKKATVPQRQIGEYYESQYKKD